MFIWTIGDVIGLAASAIIIAILCTMGVLRLLRQSRCKHARYHETSSCDAICTDCGKNLGFIGTWRDKHRTPSPQS